jgi:hypothetical protein
MSFSDGKIRRETLAKAGINAVAFDGTLLYSYKDFDQVRFHLNHRNSFRLNILEIFFFR